MLWGHPDGGPLGNPTSGSSTPQGSPVVAAARASVALRLRLAPRSARAPQRVSARPPRPRGPRVSAAPRGRPAPGPAGGGARRRRPWRKCGCGSAARRAAAREEAGRRRVLRGRADAMGRLHCTQDPVPEAVGGDMQQLNQLGAQVGRAAGARASVGPEG